MNSCERNCSAAIASTRRNSSYSNDATKSSLPPPGPEGADSKLRVSSEALKHAGASRVALTLTYLDDSTRLDVRDDGIGFEPEFAGSARNGWQAGGFGLTSMRERLESQGGA